MGEDLRSSGVPGSPGRDSAAWHWIAVASIFAAFAFGGLRLFAYVDKFAVNIFFLDDWAYLGGLFDGRSEWQLFTFQHGPHRMGLGLLLRQLVLGLSDWNSRAVAFTMAAIYLLATALALWLKRRIAGPLSLFDASIPLLFLTLGNYETWAGAADPAHGPLPLLMAIAFSLLLTIRSETVRALGALGLAATAVYTGFAIFLSLVSLPIFALLAWRAMPDRRAAALHCIALLLTLFSIASFFRAYRFQSAVDCFAFPHPRPFEYVQFIGLFFARPLAFHDVPEVLEFALALGALALCATSLTLAVQQRARNPLWLVVLTLGGFSFLFAANAAVGRVCLGVGAAVASRYVPYATAGLFAAYLAAHALPLRHAWLRPSALFLFLGLCVVHEMGPHTERSGIAALHHSKASWRDCYRRTHSIARCDQESEIPIYPRPAEVELQKKLDFLERHHWNLFAD